MPHLMPLSQIMREYRDGEEHGWETEFDYLRTEHALHLAALKASIEAEGIKTPIHLGSDGRIWDGHHRLCAAFDLGLPVVPVTTDAPCPNA